MSFSIVSALLLIIIALMRCTAADDTPNFLITPLYGITRSDSHASFSIQEQSSSTFDFNKRSFRITVSPEIVIANKLVPFAGLEQVPTSQELQFIGSELDNRWNKNHFQSKTITFPDSVHGTRMVIFSLPVASIAADATQFSVFTQIALENTATGQKTTANSTSVVNLNDALPLADKLTDLATTFNSTANNLVFRLTNVTAHEGLSWVNVHMLSFDANGQLALLTPEKYASPHCRVGAKDVEGSLTPGGELRLSLTGVNFTGDVVVDCSNSLGYVTAPGNVTHSVLLSVMAESVDASFEISTVTIRTKWSTGIIAAIIIAVIIFIIFIIVIIIRGIRACCCHSAPESGANELLSVQDYRPLQADSDIFDN